MSHNLPLKQRIISNYLTNLVFLWYNTQQKGSLYMKESKLSEICYYLRNNPILQVFTKDYRDELKYTKYMEKKLIKLSLKVEART